MRYMRKETARACPVHSMIKDKANEMLAANGHFSKEVVLEELNLSTMEDSIRWDYIREFIEEDHGVNLVPLAARFFIGKIKTKSGDNVSFISTAAERKVNPEKYIAGGHGKKTHGYALVTFEQGVMAIACLKRYRGLSNGAGKAFRAYAISLEKKNLLEDKESKKLTEPVNY